MKLNTLSAFALIASIFAVPAASFACGEGACETAVAVCGNYLVIRQDGPGPLVIQRADGTRVDDNNNFQRVDAHNATLTIDGQTLTCQQDSQ